VLTVGAPADITLLDRDPRSVTPDDLGEAVVLLTMVGGHVDVDAGEVMECSTSQSRSRRESEM
jgi:hypothetical protein